MNHYTDTLIIGGGLSGLSVAHRLQRACYGHRFMILEKNGTTGGAIRTFRERGYIAEIGPHGFLDNSPATQALLEETGLAETCIKAPLQKFVRYILLANRLQLIPQTPKKILKAPLIPWRDKFRVLCDLWKKPLPGTPSVAHWVEHRFGKALLPFADAAFTGTYAGDINYLAVDAVMPGLRQLELEHGSLLRGAYKKMRTARLHRGTTQRFRMPAMVSFPTGMEALPQRLSQFLTEGKNLFLNCPAQQIRYRGKDPAPASSFSPSWTWQVTTPRGIFHAHNLVVALPVNSAMQILSPSIPPPSSTLEIPEASLATALYAFAPPEKIPQGFGYLNPEKEKRFSLGTLFSSNMFSHRAPGDQILIETLIGGSRHPEHLDHTDEEVLDTALSDVAEILQLRTKPTFRKLIRNPSAIPQLGPEFLTLQEWRKEQNIRFPSLFILGFGWNGIGVNDMVKRAFSVATELMESKDQAEKPAEIKKIYF